MPSRVTILRDAPEGASHEVDVNDIFFSVTDAKGVMTHVNDVFIRYAQYDADEMIGKPHNLIRHDEMPGGAFKMMWDTIEDGRPFAGYVRNRAKSGSAYDVLATVTPLPNGGYLSVRTRPMTERFEAAGKLYQEANVVEHEAKANGVGRRERAVMGAEKISELLPDYDAFIRESLPEEVQALEDAGFTLPEGSGEIYDAANALYGQLDQFMVVQTAIKDAADELRKASATLVEENAVTNNVKAEMENVVTEGASRTLLLAPLQVWATMRGIIDENASSLAEVAEELYAKTANARMAIALARLHTAQTAQFSTEQGAQESMQLLVDALEVDVRQMDDAVFLHSSFRRRVELKVNSIAELTKIPLEMIRRWSQNTNDSTMGAEVAPLVEQVNKAMEAADASIAQLQRSAEKLAQAPSTDEVRAALDRLSTAVK
ncbi:PAS domain-containing protein [Corynebacterium fournieri]|uniref:PAS domain-containing protein n=1 Tax=Corynebacterium fournieri TaxID=1852390 RepID=UPI000A2EE938|nr:PAS domain-containing protein [Corynebacterium fournieri]WJY96851.1 Aerotaxis receptor [Corynebacterium fournieri]